MFNKVLLIQIPFVQNETVFPAGLLYIASYIKCHGYNIQVLDINAEKLNEHDLLERLSVIDYDIVGISALVNGYSYVKWLAREIKKIKDVPIILGNGLGTGAFETVLKNIPEIDYCVLGEGEETFLDILENYGDPSKIQGIAYRGNDQVIVLTENRTHKVDIDELPWPAYELVNMSSYIKASSDYLDTGYFTIRGIKEYERKIAYMLTSRGCPYNCKFCGRIIKKVRTRSLNNIIKEILFLKNTYSVGGIVFYDELLTMNKERTVNLAIELKKLDILWSCQGRVNLVDFDMLKKMKACGCVSIGYGIESGSEQLLKAMDKKTRISQVIESMRLARDAGLAVKVQLIFGYPGENDNTMKETINLFNKLRDPGRRFNILRPLPGSRLYDEIKKENVFTDEDEYLTHLETALDMNLPIVNLTDFENDEIKAKSSYAEGKILLNYLTYILINDPRKLLNQFILSKGSLKLVVWTLIKFILSINPSLYNCFLKDRFKEGFIIYTADKFVKNKWKDGPYNG